MNDIQLAFQARWISFMACAVYPHTTFYAIQCYMIIVPLEIVNLFVFIFWTTIKTYSILETVKLNESLNDIKFTI